MSDINEPPTKESQNSNKKGSKVPLKIIAHDDGALEITYANGKVKKRKGQSEEEYQKELEQFRFQGPKINAQNWMIELFDEQYSKYSKFLKDQEASSKSEELQEVLRCSTLFNVADRLQKFQIIHIAENQYYKRHYEKCILICDTLVQLLMIFKLEKSSKKELEEIDSIKKYCLNKLHKPTENN